MRQAGSACQVLTLHCNSVPQCCSASQAFRCQKRPVLRGALPIKRQRTAASQQTQTANDTLDETPRSASARPEPPTVHGELQKGATARTARALPQAVPTTLQAAGDDASEAEVRSEEACSVPERGAGSQKGRQVATVARLRALMGCPPKGVPEKLGDRPLRLILVGHNPSDHAW